VRVLVVYDTLHGNTAKIAQSIADGLAAAGEVVIRKMADAGRDDLQFADLVVAGCPTHAWSMSRRAKRFFQRLEQLSYDGRIAAAFDTKFRSRLAGSAAGKVSRALEKMGFQIIHKPESFFVRGMEGPLKDGERDRARDFGAQLAREAAGGAAG
jgi:flavodoxin